MMILYSLQWTLSCYVGMAYSYGCAFHLHCHLF